MATKAKIKKLTEDQIISTYIDYVLEHEMVPKSIYKFCKLNKIKETDFYNYFGSVEGIQKSIWVKFFSNTKGLMNTNKAYESFSNKDKMLTFFYTFFETLTLNRSYVLFALQQEKGMIKNLMQLKGLRRHVKAFAAELINDANADKTYRFTKHSPQLFSEGAWLQFVFVLKFWMDDNSPAFEKTDMAIEKSITTTFDVFDNTPLDNIIDFGKFLFKEKMA